jgi:heptosyltransferase-2
MDYFVYVLYRIFTSAVAAIPLKAACRLGAALGRVAYIVARPYRKLVIANLSLAYAGEKSGAEIHSLARRHFATLGANLFGSVKVATMSPAEMQSTVTMENFDALGAAISQKKGVVFVIGHLGNWELLSQLTHYAPAVAVGAIYQPLRNRYIDKHVRENRARFGLALFDRREGFGAAIKHLRHGGLVGVLVDQHAGDGGVWTPFFGRLASTSPLAATLALRTGAVLLPAAVYQDGLAKWKVVFGTPITAEQNPEQLTAEINLVFENLVRKSPADWFWVHDRWKTPQPKFLLATYKRGISFPRGWDSKLKPFRILIRSSNWLGDAVMTIPAVRAIKNGRPDAHVTIVAPEKIAALWEKVESVDAVIAISPRENVFSVARKLSGQFDAAILFPNSVRSALEVFLARVPRRAGYEAKWRSALLNQIVPENRKPAPPRHQKFRYLKIAESLGAVVRPEHLRFGEARRPPDRGRKLQLGLCPGADYGPAKRWLPERFAVVAEQISTTTDCEWLLFGTSRDKAAGELIERVLDGKCVNLIGKTTMTELVDHLSRCALLLTNDTGTMHLAAFLDVPTVAIFGSTEPALTAPMGENHRIIRHHVECSPCFLRKCPIDFRCMKSVATSEVESAINAILSSPALSEGN